MTFKPLEGDTAVIMQNGVFKSVDLFEWEGGLYAKAAGGFVRLYADGRASKAGILIKTLYCDSKLWKSPLGRLQVIKCADSKPLTDQNANTLMIGAE